MKNRFVIYSVMVGGYDQVLQPTVLDDRFDYVLFSNDFKDTKIGVWDIRSIPIPDDISSSDFKRLSRYPKMHPETLLSEYDASLYIDANIQIVNRWIYDRVVDLYTHGEEYAGVKMATEANELCDAPRDDIYAHAYDMVCNGVVHDMETLQLMRTLYKEGFPVHYGLMENNIIYRMHTDCMRELDEEWWSYVVSFSFRDQFSWMHLLWKRNFPLKEYILPEGMSAWTGIYTKMISHPTASNVKKMIDMDKEERFRNNIRNFDSVTYDLCLNHWMLMVRHSSSNVLYYFSAGMVLLLYPIMRLKLLILQLNKKSRRILRRMFSRIKRFL